jgi:phage shock protein PspC (stress-responsive transcriptional regulator)
MKKLYRSRKERMLGGVCGGIAEYFAIDPVIVRIVAVAFFFAGGSAVLAYIIGLIIIPNEPSGMPMAEKPAQATPPAAPVQPAAPRGENPVPLVLGVVLILIGTVFLLHNIPFFNPYYWQVWRFTRNFFWPSLLIAFGVYIIARGWKK